MARTDFTPASSAELWIFDGLDDDTVPYEISLTHPRTGRPCSFALGSKNGRATIGEVRIFKSDKPASFLSVVGVRGKPAGAEQQEEEDENNNSSEEVQMRSRREQGAIVSNQELRFVSEIDPIFLLLPILVRSESSTTRNKGGKGVFLQFDDLMDQWRDKNPHVSQLIDEGRHFEGTSKVSTCMSSTLRAALGRCCDTVTAGNETMYRFSEDRFFIIVLEKARRVVAAGLSPSLEDMAQRAVEPPYTGTSRSPMSAKQQLQNDIDADSVGTAGLGEDQEDDSQASKADSVFSQPVTPAVNSGTSEGQQQAPEPKATITLELMRLRVALDLILSNYVPPFLSKKILAWLDDSASSTPLPAADAKPDFSPLKEQIAEVRRQRAAILLSQQNSNFSLKRGIGNDELAEQQAEKRRKKEEEDRKRKLESVGLRALKKVDTSGMKKLSAFFTAKPKTK